MGAALVATRHKVGVGGRQLFQRRHDVIALGACGVGLGANQHKVVVHHIKALGRKAVGHKLVFGHAVVHKQHIGIAPARHVNGLARAQCHHLDVDAVGLLEVGQQVGKQPRLFCGGGGRHHDGCRLSRDGCRENSS